MAYIGRRSAAAALVTGDIPNDSITGAKIVDDAIDSEHYVAGSVDAAHVAADVATQAELEAQRTDSSITTLGTVTAGNLSNTAIVYPTGHVLQTIRDVYAMSDDVIATTSADIILGTNLQCTITCASTSNHLVVSLFVPSLYNQGQAARGVYTGIKHGDTGWSSTGDLGGVEFVDSYNGYINTTTSFVDNLNLTMTGTVPNTSAMLLRPWFKTVGGDYTLFALDGGEATLILQ